MDQILRVLCSGICTTLLWLAFHSGANAKPYDVPVSPEELKPNKRPIGVFTDATINLSQGLYSTSYPIQVPPGRNGLAPSLALEYHSTSERSTIGIGWDLPLDHVRRSLRSGTPRYVGPGSTDEDELEFRLGQYTGTLVRVLDENGLPLYRPKIEGAFAKFYYNLVSDSWVVQDRSGRTWYLGGDGAKDYDPESPDRTFAWYVKRVVDPQHNMIEYTYETVDPVRGISPGNIYLTEVAYDLKESTSRPTYYPHVVLNWLWGFGYPSQAISYRKGYRSELDYNFLSSIQVHAYNQDGSTEQTRSYTLEPGWEEQPGGQVVVRSVQPQNLPTATFTYNPPSFVWNTVRDLANTATGPNILETRYLEATRHWDEPGYPYTPRHSVTTSMLVDVDGDGDLDQLIMQNLTGQRQWRENTGWGFQSGTQPVGWPPGTFEQGWRHTVTSSDGEAVRTYQDMFDIDGDGKVDLVWAHLGQLTVCPGNGLGTFGAQGCEIWNATGSPYVENVAATYSEPPAYTHNVDQAGFLDMNGDGLPDFVIVEDNGASTEHLLVYRNLGRAPGGVARGLDPTPVTIDMPQVYEGHGTHTGIRASYKAVIFPESRTQHYWDLRDVNGDGLLDLFAPRDNVVRYGKGLGPDHSYFDMSGLPFDSPYV